MVAGVWGKKIGMTQIFVSNKVVPVTVIDVSYWVVTQVKNAEQDGYLAVQVGRVKDRYAKQEFSTDWIKKHNKYFSFIREVKIKQGQEAAPYVVGQKVDFHLLLTAGDMVDVTGTTKGAGFAGAVRRHGFTGGRDSHGSTLGNRPGSLSFMRSQGRVIKGKRLPGHMGTLTRMVKNLEVVKIYPEEHLVLVKGAVPGKSGSLVFIRRA